MKYFTLIFFLTISNCESKKEMITDDELASILNNSIIKYHQTKEDKYLDSAYFKLKQNKSYNDSELTNPNLQLTITLLMNLKEYDELEKLLTNTKYLNEYNRINTLNITKYMKLKDTDKSKADSYIKDNLTIINDSLNKKPKDSLMYADYFSMRMFLVGKENTLNEIDSMESSQHEYSKVFYKILQESIESFPDEMLSKQ
ncbi:hypothetical protein [Formosa maritima]|uniref:Uncharacterized protein n=1 Tax=Formosa maritima TaxID=2592046 RepID=A0A5D0GDE9_9FLAO|nr:hypothetical protein [Formosa maritima]TYA56801.1 hypothetical protein FVF61_05595 [Formosa maritima]